VVRVDAPLNLVFSLIQSQGLDRLPLSIPAKMNLLGGLAETYYATLNVTA
jgi:hypothetical protein